MQKIDQPQPQPPPPEDVAVLTGVSADTEKIAFPTRSAKLLRLLILGGDAEESAEGSSESRDGRATMPGRNTAGR